MKKHMRLLFVTLLCSAAASSFQLKADANKDLFDAIHEKNVGNVRSSIKNGADVNSPREYQIDDYVLITSPLEFAIISAGYEAYTPKINKIIKILIKNGAEITSNLFQRAKIQENEKIVEILLKASARAK